jgi:hypothetical protein
VQHHVPVRVAERADGGVHLHPAKHHPAIRHQGMEVLAEADA